MKTCGNSDKVQNLIRTKLRLSIYILLLCYLSTIYGQALSLALLYISAKSYLKNLPQISAPFQTPQSADFPSPSLRWKSSLDLELHSYPVFLVTPKLHLRCWRTMQSKFQSPMTFPQFYGFSQLIFDLNQVYVIGFHQHSSADSRHAKILLAVFIVVVNLLLGMQSENKRTLVSYLKPSEEKASKY